MNKHQTEADIKAENAKPELTAEEEKQVKTRGAPRAAVVYETVREEGEFELQRTVSGLAWSGLAAGLSMGFSLVAEGLLRHHLPDAPWRPLVSELGYSAVILDRNLRSSTAFHGKYSDGNFAASFAERCGNFEMRFSPLDDRFSRQHRRSNHFCFRRFTHERF